MPRRLVLAIARVLRFTGVTSLLRFLANRSAGGFPGIAGRAGRGVQILVYHRVTDAPGPFLPATPVEVFRAQMAYLAERCSVVTLAEAVEAIERDDVPENAAVVTFDDGYRDNHDVALPILTSFGLPATVFLATDAIDEGPLLWHDRVFRAFATARADRLDGFGPDRVSASWSDRVGFAAARTRVLDSVRYLDESEREDAVARLPEALDSDPLPEDPRLMLSWDEVRSMAAAGIEFGSHTASHPVVSTLTDARAREELASSRARIERELGGAVTSFAYPNGRPGDFDARTRDHVREAGYRCAVTTVPGTNRRSADRFELRRFGVWDTDPDVLSVRLALARLSG